MPSTTHVPDQDLYEYVGQTLDSERASYIRAHILKCTACKDQLIGVVVGQLSRLKASPEARRGHERRPLTDATATLQALCPLSLERVAVEVVDTSKTGFGLRMTVFLEPGTIVDLRIGATPAVGTVRYCRNLGGHTYQAGVELQAPVTTRE